MIGKYLLPLLTQAIANPACHDVIRYCAADVASYTLYACPPNCDMFKKHIKYEEMIAIMKGAKGSYRLMCVCCFN